VAFPDCDANGVEIKPESVWAALQLPTQGGGYFQVPSDFTEISRRMEAEIGQSENLRQLHHSSLGSQNGRTPGSDVAQAKPRPAVHLERKRSGYFAVQNYQMALECRAAGESRLDISFSFGPCGIFCMAMLLLGWLCCHRLEPATATAWPLACHRHRLT
jgi:hypothetical protein